MRVGFCGREGNKLAKKAKKYNLAKVIISTNGKNVFPLCQHKSIPFPILGHGGGRQGVENGPAGGDSDFSFLLQGGRVMKNCKKGPKNAL